VLRKLQVLTMREGTSDFNSSREKKSHSAKRRLRYASLFFW
jgi:hypothetical protein